MRFPRLKSLVCLSITSIIVSGGAVSAARQLPEAPHAIVPIQSHDFGSVDQGTTLVHGFTVRNAGKAPLKVMRLSLSGPGMSAKMKPAVAPGDQAELRIEWNTAGVRGNVEGRAVLEINDPATPQLTFVLTGIVITPVEFVPYQAVFASVYRGESADRSVRIAVNRERPLSINRLEQQGDHFRATINPLEPGRLYELRVTVPATAGPGRYREAVFLYTDDPKVPRLMVPVNVLVKSDLYASPEALDFGRVSLKELAGNPSLLELLTQTLMVRKRAGQFSITGVTSEAPFLTIRRSPDENESSNAFRIDVGLVKDRLQPGPISGSIRIVTGDKEFPVLIVPVRGEVQ